MLTSQMAVDVAHLLDIDPEVTSWRCAVPVGNEAGGMIADFAVDRREGREFLILRGPVEGATAIETSRAVPVRFIGAGDIDPVRLENARLLLPFAGWRVSIDDRIRLLAMLDEEGSVTLADCLSILRNASRPIAAVASLALAGIVDLELDRPLSSRSRITRRPD